MSRADHAAREAVSALLERVPELDALSSLERLDLAGRIAAAVADAHECGDDQW